MSITVKILRPGVLILADAGLRLGPGETAEIAVLTPQIQKAIDTGRLARLDDGAAGGVFSSVPPTGSAPDAAEPDEGGNDTDSGGRRAGLVAKRPPLDALRRKAEETTGVAG
jgi:hypothetical protein